MYIEDRNIILISFNKAVQETVRHLVFYWSFEKK